MSKKDDERTPKLSKQQRRQQMVAEESVPMRVAVCLMAFVCMVVACAFVRTSPIMTLAYVTGVIVGSYLSYKHRHERSQWIARFVPIMAALVMITCGWDLYGEFRSTSHDFLPPLVHWLAGAFTLHTFDMRTNKDLSYSSALGLGMICMMAPAAHSTVYGACIIVYMLLGSLMLFYECQSRTANRWVAHPPIELAPVLADRAINPADRIKSAGIASLIFTILAVPAISFALYTFLPRCDLLYDQLVARLAIGLAGSLLKPDASEAIVAPSKNGAQPRQDSYKRESKKRTGKSGQGKNKSGTTTANGEPNASKTDDTMNLRTGLGRGADTVIFKVASNHKAYVRRFCYDDFDGVTWTVSTARRKGEEFYRPESGTYDFSKLKQFHIPKYLPTTKLEQHYTISSDMGKLVPFVWIPSRSDLHSYKVFIDNNGQVSSNGELSPGTTYSVMSLLPIYDIKRMMQLDPIGGDQADGVRASAAEYLDLPDNFDERITALAQQVAGQGHWFAKALRLTQYLRTHYQYLLESKTKTKNITSDFLFDSKKGDCKEYATSFVLMCRSIGIPARMVGGYAPGTLNGLTGEREVRIRDAHAWGEALIPGYGWVPFDCVPGGYMPALEEEQSLGMEAMQSAIHKSGIDQQKLIEYAQYAAAALAVLVAAGLLGAWGYRRYAAHRKGPAKHPASKIYSRTQKHLKRLKIIRRASETPKELAKRVQTAFEELPPEGKLALPGLPDKFDLFIQRYQDCYFGNKEEQLPDLERLSQEIRRLITSPGK
ncbi:MAG TPA: transglutaminaseTgpA domain-containing protein [Planktothrix sp.]|jgi:transglutaminase-like putative cysteine protease